MRFPDDVISRAGRLLYRELPEEYRYRDPGPPVDGEDQHHDPSDDREADPRRELRDLEAYLHGFGHLLDLVRHTTEQAYADAFAEPTDDGLPIQTWLIPYLAELVGAELLAPDPERRLQELNNSVLWSKAKGTLHSVDAVGEVLSGAATVVREGWALTATCPRPGLPPFSVPLLDEGEDRRGRSAMPLGCPDLRRMDRAVLDDGGADPLFRLAAPLRDADGVIDASGSSVFWKQRAPGGAPCFPGAYDDRMVRCPDLRDASTLSALGPHPRRNLVHLRPPDGLFERGLKVVPLAAPGDLRIRASDQGRVIGPQQVLELVGERGPVPDRLIVELDADLSIPRGAVVEFRDVLFTGRVALGDGEERPVRIRVANGARLTMSNAAAEQVHLIGNGEHDDAQAPPLRAANSLLGAITGPKRFAELVHCTVLGDTDVARLHASDCLLGTIGSSLDCDDAETTSCVRYSRFDRPEGDADCVSSTAPSNTSDRPRFVARYLPAEDGGCALRLPRYGEPGCAVLDTTAPASIAAGAEDDGEMGVGHQFFLAAGRRALAKKLSAFLPLGQHIALRYDPFLAHTPPSTTGTGGDVT